MEGSAGPDILILAFLQQEIQLSRKHDFEIQFMLFEVSTTSLGYAFQTALSHGASLRNGRKGRSFSFLYLATGFPQPNSLIQSKRGKILQFLEVLKYCSNSKIFFLFLLAQYYIKWVVLPPGTGTDAVIESCSVRTLAQKMYHSFKNTKVMADVLETDPKHQHWLLHT